MKVLHISNDFAGSKVHSNLVKNLDLVGTKQIVYCPVRDRRLIGNNQFFSIGTEFIYSYIIKSWYKFFYHFKRKILYKDLKCKVNLEDIDLIHAATLFSDGGLAYKAYKEYNIPYLVAVRNTDINAFAKLQPHVWQSGRKILLNAKAIFFISKALQCEFESLSFVKPIINQIRAKFILQVNGIEREWLENVKRTPNLGKDVLYIGDFSSNKNVIRLMEAVKLLRSDGQYKDVNLTIIGGGKDKKGRTLKAVKGNHEFVSYLGRIYDKIVIQEIMRQHALFVMPSIHETFGLVYIEALSQNLPVVYTKGQGIDKLFNEGESPVGIGVNPLSVEEIKNAIKKIMDNNIYTNKQVDFSLFSWSNIAYKYKEIYSQIINIK